MLQARGCSGSHGLHHPCRVRGSPAEWCDVSARDPEKKKQERTPRSAEFTGKARLRRRRTGLEESVLFGLEFRRGFWERDVIITLEAREQMRTQAVRACDTVRGGFPLVRVVEGGAEPFNHLAPAGADPRFWSSCRGKVHETAHCAHRLEVKPSAQISAPQILMPMSPQVQLGRARS